MEFGHILIMVLVIFGNSIVERRYFMLFLAEDSSMMLDLIRTILLDICNIIYKLIIIIYELFMAVGDATIISSNSVQIIYNRFY